MSSSMASNNNLIWAGLTTAGAGVVLLYAMGFFKSGISKIPGPAGKPILGHVLHLRSPGWHWLLTRWAEEYGGIYRIRIFGGNLLVVTDPMLANGLLTDSTDLPKDRVFYRFFDEMFHPFGKSSSMTASRDNKTCQAVRRALTKSFASSELSEDCECTKDKALLLARRIASMLSSDLSEPVTLDVSDLCARLGLDVLALSKFGYDPQGVESEANEGMMLKLMTDCCQEWFARMQFPYRSWLWMVVDDIGSKHQLYPMLQEFMQHMWRNIENLGEPTDSNVTIAAQLMRLRQHPDVQLREDYLMAELGSLMLHGGLGAGHTLAWVLYQLAANPKVQAKVTDELDAQGVLGSTSNLVGLQVQHLGKMPYLDAVVREAMRLQPALHLGTLRKMDRTVKAGKTTIPKGTRVWINFHGMFNNKRYFERPTEFLPERWMAKPAAVPSSSNGAGTDTSKVSDNSTKTKETKETKEQQGAPPTFVDSWTPFPQPSGAAPEEPQKRKEKEAAAPAKQLPVTPETAEAPLSNPGAHMPFGVGGSACPAQAYVRVFLTTSLVVLLSFYRFELRNTGLDDEVDATAAGSGPRRGKGGMVEKAHLVLQPEKGLVLRCYMRGVPSQP